MQICGAPLQIPLVHGKYPRLLAHRRQHLTLVSNVQSRCLSILEKMMFRRDGFFTETHVLPSLIPILVGSLSQVMFNLSPLILLPTYHFTIFGFDSQHMVIVIFKAHTKAVLWFFLMIPVLP